MRQTAADMALIRQRLEKLERENRRLRRGLAAVALGLGASLTLGFTSTPGLRPTLGFGMGRGGGTVRPWHSAGPPGAPEQFVLRDGQGVIRAKLDASGRTLAFFDDRGSLGGTLELKTGDSAAAAGGSSSGSGIRALPPATPVQADSTLRPLGGAWPLREATAPPAFSRDPFTYSTAAAGGRKARAPDRAPPSPPRMRLPVGEPQILMAQLGTPESLAFPASPASAPEATPATTSSSAPWVAPLAVTLKVVGYIENPGEPKAVVVSDGPEVHVVHQGEVFDERFQVVRVSGGSVEIRDTALQETLTLPINP